MKLDRIDPQKASTAELQEAIKEKALDDLLMVKKRISAPDHLINPEVFAWAMKNLYTAEQKKGIWFDHDENEEIFCRRHQIDTSTTIEEHVRRILIETREALKNLDSRDFDECCSCPDH